MAHQYEVDKINELCDEIEVMVDELKSMLPEEATQDFDIDTKLDGIRMEADDIEGEPDMDQDNLRRELEDAERSIAIALETVRGY